MTECNHVQWSFGKRNGRGYKWVGIFLLVISVSICLPAILVKLGRQSPARGMENYVVLSSQETWLRQKAGEDKAWLVPSLSSRVRIQKPPMSVWLSLFMWRNLDPATASYDQILWSARMVSVALAVLALVGVFWLGLQLGDIRTASLAVLITGTFHLFIHHARMASYDTQITGWLTMAVAAWLWSVWRNDLSKGRRLAGWLLAGLMLGCAVLTKGPISLLLFLVPILIALSLLPLSKRDGWIGLILVMLLGLSICLPWYLYIFRQVPNAVSTLLVEYRNEHYKSTGPLYYAQILWLVFPWTFWFAGSLVYPFLLNPSAQRRAFLFAWSWFVVLIVAFSFPNMKAPRYLIPLLPAVGLMVAQFVVHWQDVLREGTGKKALIFFRWIHWGLLLFVPSGLLLLLLAQHGMGFVVSWIPKEVKDIPLALGVGGCLVLIVLAWLGLSRHARGQVQLAVLFTVIWMSVASFVGYTFYPDMPFVRSTYQEDAERVASLSRDCPLFYLHIDPKIDIPPTIEFLFYVRRVVPSISPAELNALKQRGERVNVIVRAGFCREEIVEPIGFYKLIDYADDDDKHRSLYTSQLRTPSTGDLQ